MSIYIEQVLPVTPSGHAPTAAAPAKCTGGLQQIPSFFAKVRLRLYETQYLPIFSEFAK
jgi:hypothetical protein